MKIGVIDIGSNSVRLMLWADGNTLYKRIETTRLGEGLNFEPVLTREAIARTAAAVAAFCRMAEGDGAERVYAFATAAVRSARNGGEFVEAAYNACGVLVDVISGEEEAAIGLCGALGGGDGGIIDVGGASTEVTVRRGGRTIYSKSVDIGTVRILDACGRELEAIRGFVRGRLSEYGEADFSGVDMRAVGGTASRLGAVEQKLTLYDSRKIHGTELTAGRVHELAERLTGTPVEEIRRTTICGKSADLVGGGAELLGCVMDWLNIGKVTVSESDNLDGYLIKKVIGG